MLQKDLINAAHEQAMMRRHSSLITGAVSILLLFLFLALIGYSLHHTSPLNPKVEAQAGVLNLSGVNFNEDGFISLVGEWEFYWLELLEAEDFKSGDQPAPLFAKVPGIWNRLALAGENLPGNGYATYRLHVKNADLEETLAGINISSTAASFNLLINGEQVATRGQVGSTAETTISSHQGSTVYFPIVEDDFEMIIQVANFSYPRGGLRKNIYLGTGSAINAFANTLSFRQVFLVGALFMITIISLTISIFRRKTLSSFYLVLSCISLVILYDSLNQLMIYEIFPGISFDAVIRIWFLSTVWAPYFILLLINALFPTRYAHISNKAVGIIVLGFTFFYLFFPIRLVGLDLYFGNIIPVLIGFYTIYIAVIAFRKGMRGSILYLLGLLFGYLTITHDILHFNYIINSPFNEVLFYGLFLFTFSLAAAQGLQFIDSAEKTARAELLFLQSQIRPHFIHNALNTIISISRKDPDRARRLLIDFSNYLRSSFDFKDLIHKVPVEQEIDLVKSYVALEQARFGEKLKVNYYIADISFMVLPLILQPLVENSVIHGLRYKEGEGTINISVQRERQEVRLVIEDDGVGINLETMRAVKNPEFVGSNNGLGLKNIEERLLNIYGRGLDIKSSPGAGTTVTISIPLEDDFND